MKRDSSQRVGRRVRATAAAVALAALALGLAYVLGHAPVAKAGARTVNLTTGARRHGFDLSSRQAVPPCPCGQFKLNRKPA
jgi:hypothetical protein